MLLFSVGPFTQTNSNKLESVQRSAARYVLADYQSSVPSMTQQLEWKPIQQVDKQQKQCECTLYWPTPSSTLIAGPLDQNRDIWISPVEHITIQCHRGSVP